MSNLHGAASGLALWPICGAHAQEQGPASHGDATGHQQQHGRPAAAAPRQRRKQSTSWPGGVGWGRITSSLQSKRNCQRNEVGRSGRALK